ARLLADVAGHRLGLLHRLVGGGFGLIHHLVDSTGRHAPALLRAALIIACRPAGVSAGMAMMRCQFLIHLEVAPVHMNLSTENIRHKETLPRPVKLRVDPIRMIRNPGRLVSVRSRRNPSISSKEEIVSKTT